MGTNIVWYDLFPADGQKMRYRAYRLCDWNEGDVVEVEYYNVYDDPPDSPCGHTRKTTITAFLNNVFSNKWKCEYTEKGIVKELIGKFPSLKEIITCYLL